MNVRVIVMCILKEIVCNQGLGLCPYTCNRIIIFRTLKPKILKRAPCYYFTNDIETHLPNIDLDKL